MLICLLTALIARSSHRRLQREDAFFFRSREETREERTEEERKERRGDLNRICKLSLTHTALQTNKNNVCTRRYATLAVLTVQ